MIAARDAVIDAHQHVWELSRRRYGWLDGAPDPLRRDFRQEEAREVLDAVGITGRILVQAADTYDDTMGMLAVAAADRTVRGVVGWVPLDRPDEAAAALGAYAGTAVVGIRCLSHDLPDPRWLLRDEVLAGVDAVIAADLPLDVAAVTIPQLETVVDLAAARPDLTIVLDHLGRPPAEGARGSRWAELVSALAEHPRVAVKLSGLAGADPDSWSAARWQDAVDHAVDAFGAARTMLGSDWPVSTLHGDARAVWREHLRCLDGRSADERRHILAGTASRVYRLEERT